MHFYPTSWGIAKSWTIVAPRPANLYDLKVLASSLDCFRRKSWEADDVRLFVNESWHRRHREVGNDEDMAELNDDFKEFFLELRGGEESE